MNPDLNDTHAPQLQLRRDLCRCFAARSTLHITRHKSPIMSHASRIMHHSPLQPHTPLALDRRSIRRKRLRIHGISLLTSMTHHTPYSWKTICINQPVIARRRPNSRQRRAIRRNSQKRRARLIESICAGQRKDKSRALGQNLTHENKWNGIELPLLRACDRRLNGSQ